MNNNVPVFSFDQEPISKIEIRAKDLLSAHFASLQGDRGPLTKIEKHFRNTGYFNAFIFSKVKMVKAISRSSPVYSSLLHSVIQELLKRKRTAKVVFAAYDGPDFPCNKLNNGENSNEVP